MESKKYDKLVNITKKRKQALDTENKLVVTRGERKEERENTGGGN